MIADDLFAGAGGWDVAAQWLGIEARGIENMPAARATRDAAGLVTIHDDAWTFKPRYRAVDGRVELTASGLIASPPCQTFSQAGKGAGRKALDDVLELLPQVATLTLPQLREAGERFGDDRTALVLTPLWFALHHPYRWLAWEQVPTVLPVWEACAEVLRDAGFSVWTGNLQAEQYGVPQTRKRAVLIASRDVEVAQPTPTHSRYYPRTPEKLDAGVEKWVSMAEALGWRADFALRASFSDSGYDKPTPRIMDLPAATVTEKHRSAKWVVFRASNAAHAAVRELSKPAPTVMFGAASNDVRWYPEGCTTPGVAEFAESRCQEARRVTVAEAGVLQSFPADYPWQGPPTKQYLQAGNAIPPLLAAAALCATLGESYGDLFAELQGEEDPAA